MFATSTIHCVLLNQTEQSRYLGQSKGFLGPCVQTHIYSLKDLKSHEKKDANEDRLKAINLRSLCSFLAATPGDRGYLVSPKIIKQLFRVH